MDLPGDVPTVASGAQALPPGTISLVRRQYRQVRCAKEPAHRLDNAHASVILATRVVQHVCSPPTAAAVCREPIISGCARQCGTVMDAPGCMQPHHCGRMPTPVWSCMHPSAWRLLCCTKWSVDTLQQAVSLFYTIRCYQNCPGARETA